MVSESNICLNILSKRRVKILCDQMLDVRRANLTVTLTVRKGAPARSNRFNFFHICVFGAATDSTTLLGTISMLRNFGPENRLSIYLCMVYHESNSYFEDGIFSAKKKGFR